MGPAWHDGRAAFAAAEGPAHPVRRVFGRRHPEGHHADDYGAGRDEQRHEVGHLSQGVALLTRRLPGRGSLILALAAGLGVSMSRGALAQSTAQIPLQFDFQTPGARSMAMGGAFIGAADDASAAFTNPAGLAFLTAAGKRELTAEGRFSSIETPFLSGGRISGSVTGKGIDTVPNPIYGSDTDREARPGFVSLLVPV